MSRDRVTCLAHCPGLLVSLGEGSWDLQAWEFGCCHVRALQSHSEAWSHTPAAHKLWCQGVLRAWGSGEGVGALCGRRSSGLHDSGCVRKQFGVGQMPSVQILMEEQMWQGGLFPCQVSSPWRKLLLGEP